MFNVIIKMVGACPNLGKQNPIKVQQTQNYSVIDTRDDQNNSNNSVTAKVKTNRPSLEPHKNNNSKQKGEN